MQRVPRGLIIGLAFAVGAIAPACGGKTDAGAKGNSEQCRSACEKITECLDYRDYYSSGSPGSRTTECTESCLEALTSSSSSGPYGADERAETRAMVNCINGASCSTLTEDCYGTEYGSGGY